VLIVPLFAPFDVIDVVVRKENIGVGLTKPPNQVPIQPFASVATTVYAPFERFVTESLELIAVPVNEFDQI